MAQPVKIGALRHRITIQELTLADDGQGGSIETWTDLATVWADLQPASTREAVFSEQIQYRRTHKVVIRYLADLTIGVTQTMRFIFEDRTFQIKSVRRLDERKFFLLIDAEEKVAT